jgi:hypothetical protein
MSEGAQRDALEALATHLVDALRPLDEALRDEESFRSLMYSLGWDAHGLPPSYVTVADAVVQAAFALAELADGPDTAEVLEVIEAAGQVYTTLGALDEAPAGIDPAEFLPEIADRLLEYLLARYLATYAPRWFALLELLGVVALEDHEPAGARPGFTRLRFDWAAIPAVLADPGSIPGRVFAWGTPDLVTTALFEPLEELASGLGLLTSTDTLSDDDAAVLQDGSAERPARTAFTVTLFDFPTPSGEAADVGLLVAELPAEGTAPPGIVVRPAVPESVAAEVAIGGGWSFRVRAGTDLADQFALVIRPGELAVRYPGKPGQPLPSAGAGLSLVYATTTPRILLGRPDATRLELTAIEVGAAVDLRAGQLELTALAGVEGLAAVLSTGGSDGFLGSVLGGGERRLEVPLRLRWSSRHGVEFLTSAGFEMTLHPDLDAGVLRIDKLDLGLRLSVDGAPGLQLRVAAAISGALGPFSFTVDRLGIELPVRLTPGNAGPFDLQMRPLWPTGIGLAIETPAVSGGGFLLLDPEAGRYVGVFELTLIETVSVKAIAIIDTKLPGGDPAFALLIMITADGFTPIQLGMGFSLTGIGGLLALNRTVDAGAVRGGLSDGVLDSVLFVKDPVRNANKVISTLDRVFPIAPDRLVIGPLAEISWGSPPLVKLRIALLLEIPQPIRAVLLAALSVALPREKDAIVELHVDAIGVLDLGRGELSLDASLHHSRLLKFALTGDMALRLNWGRDPAFVLSVGGFHPKFAPPRGLRPLNRLALTLTGGDNPMVRFETYLAVTSNTIQMGARVTVYAALGGFGIDGGGSFDALIQWSPFALDVAFAAWVRVFGPSGTLLAISVSVNVTGPTPWHITGSASIKLLFFSISVGIDLTVGETAAPQPVETVDVAGLLWEQVTDQGSWDAVLPADVTPAVTLAPPGTEAAPLVAHPLAVIGVRQRVVPLGPAISRIGAAVPTEGTRSYQLDVAGPHGVATEELNDLFALGQYTEVSDDARLAAPSFQPLAAGVRLRAGTASTLGPVLSCDLAVETLDVTDLEQPGAPGARVEAVPA